MARSRAKLALLVRTMRGLLDLRRVRLGRFLAVVALNSLGTFSAGSACMTKLGSLARSLTAILSLFGLDLFACVASFACLL